MLGGGAVNYAGYTAAVLLLPKSALLPLVAVAIGGIAGMTVNFVSAILWFFKDQGGCSPNPSFTEHTHQSQLREERHRKVAHRCLINQAVGLPASVDEAQHHEYANRTGKRRMRCFKSETNLSSMRHRRERLSRGREIPL
jgi:hypothetical protein